MIPSRVTYVQLKRIMGALGLTKEDLVTRIMIEPGKITINNLNDKESAERVSETMTVIRFSGKMLAPRLHQADATVQYPHTHQEG